jgi:hypothetical protein
MTGDDGDGDLVPNRLSLFSHELPRFCLQNARERVEGSHFIALLHQYLATYSHGLWWGVFE